VPAADALHELRAGRRRKRIKNLDWFEAAYRAYLVGIVGIVITLVLSGWLGDDPVTAGGLLDVEDNGPALVGLVVAVAIAIGLRSGSRGGPLAIEPAEVRYVLLAPVDRRRALIGPALRQLRFGCFVGIVVGAVCGQFAHRRLPGAPAAWIAAGAVGGVLMALALLGVALLASGCRLPRWAATLIALALIGWAVADLSAGIPAPTTSIGSLMLWPLRVHPIDLLGAVALVAVTIVGLLLVGRTSVEALERRTSLVGQLRFAVTVQDLRTVIVLRRQLALDAPRLRPWCKVPGRGRFTVWRRTWHGLLRFPAVRIGRVLGLAAIAGLALGAATHGNALLVLASALLLFLAGLDLIEPLSQEMDHAERHELLPVVVGALRARHLPGVAVATIPVALIVGAAAALAGASVGLAALLALPAVWCGVAGAAVSVGMGAPEPVKDGQLLPPEVAGMTIAMRTAWPIIIAAIGSLPAFVADRAADRDTDPIAAATQPVMLAILVVAGAVAWLRYREEIHAWWRRILQEGEQARKASTSRTAP
jgi:hypothetical protein